MKVFEVSATFKVIQEGKIWIIFCEQGLFDTDWRIIISCNKGGNYTFKHFGPLNNDTVIQLLKDNLIML